MKPKTLYCPASSIPFLVSAINEYALAAYPPGGSECAQSAREALQTAAAQIQVEYDEAQQSVVVNRRLIAQMKAAVDYYFESIVVQTTDSVHQHQLLLAVLSGDMMKQSAH